MFVKTLTKSQKYFLTIFFRCGSVKATIERVVTERPRYLVLQINRYTYKNYTVSEIKTGLEILL